ncbi:MAG: AmmeMemoRadiSam system protein A [Coriobacteriales bacterium]|nr:AmmeMemoRadiSam system protein A [Coriobacteriales bacterium]
MSEVFGVLAPHPPIMVDAVGGERARVTRLSIDALNRAAAALAAYDPDVVVITSPHAPSVFDAFAVDTSSELSGSFSQFGASHASYHFHGHPPLAREIIDQLGDIGLPAIERSVDPRLSAGLLDHGVLVPMSYLDPQGRWPLVVVSYAGLDYEAHRNLGRAIHAAADALGLSVAMVASGDCSHRLTPDAPAGYSPKGSELDETIVSLVRDGRFGDLERIDPEVVEEGGECGLRSFVAMGGFAGEDPAPAHVLSYEGPWGVGYMTALVGERALALDASTATPSSGGKGGMPGEAESPPVALARQAIEAHVERGERLEPAPLDDPDLPPQAGTFVSLHRGGQLRGSIGTIMPTRDTLADEIVHNAIQAAMRDPRFPPLQPDEIADLDVKVDVLHPPEACTISELDPQHYGVIVTSGWRRGLLLPDLDGVDDIAEQVDIAMRKGGILAHEPCRFERFKVDRYT